MAVDIKGLGEIKILVDHFYLKIRQDALLGPVFEQRINGDWTKHLQKMYGFWDTGTLFFLEAKAIKEVLF